MGNIWNIQRFCVDDGPGIRTTVFLAGCPLCCAWCHNPETQAGHTGRQMDVEQVLFEVQKDRIFYENSGGGLTLSGGEPLAQWEFSLALLKQAKTLGLHTCVETCGFGHTQTLLQLAEVTDLFLYDWKLTDPRLHKQHTGADNTQIRENLLALDGAGAKTVLRCPIIPGVNDTLEHFTGIGDLAESLRNVQHIELEPYHALGVHKYAPLGRPAPDFPEPNAEQVAAWISEIQKHTRVNVKKAKQHLGDTP